MNDSPVLIDINLIAANPYQVRLAEDAAVVAELAANIEKNSLLQLPTVRIWDDIGLNTFAGVEVPKVIQEAGFGYQLAFGHTRLAHEKGDCFLILKVLGSVEPASKPLKWEKAE